MDEREEQRTMAEDLYDAVGEGDLGRVRKLLAAGTDADAWGQVNRDGDLPLQAAARLRTPDTAAIVEALLEAGANIDFQGDYGSTALHRAVYEEADDGWAVARMLIRRGANPSIWDKDSLIPAEAAANVGHEEAVLAMLDEGMPVETAGCAGSLLHYVAWDSVRLVRELLDRGADPNVSTPKSRITPLHRAAESFGEGGEESAEIALILLASGADPEAKDAAGKTPVELANETAAEAVPERIGAFASILEARVIGVETGPGISGLKPWTGPRA
jgi:ankyrin repeat protein